MKNSIYIEIENLVKIINKKGVLIEIEDRGNWKDYGIFNHAEIINYINKADNDPWDVVIPGYSRRIKHGNKYTTKDIIGILYLSNGNHKIFIRINENKYGGFNSLKMNRDIKKFCKNYAEGRNIELNYMEFRNGNSKL